MLVQFLTSFYVADIYGTNDLLGIKRGERTRFPIHVCLLKNERLHLMT